MPGMQTREDNGVLICGVEKQKIQWIITAIRKLHFINIPNCYFNVVPVHKELSY